MIEKVYGHVALCAPRSEVVSFDLAQRRAAISLEQILR